MVTITNGIKMFRVTEGAVKTYKSMGFRVITDEEVNKTYSHYEHFDDATEISDFTSKEKDIVDNEDIEEGTNEYEVFINELLEKPLSRWTNEEVKEFVKIKGIDTSGAQKVSQVREIIKNYLEEEQRNA